MNGIPNKDDEKKTLCVNKGPSLPHVDKVKGKKSSNYLLNQCCLCYLIWWLVIITFGMIAFVIVYVTDADKECMCSSNDVRRRVVVLEHKYANISTQNNYSRDIKSRIVVLEDKYDNISSQNEAVKDVRNRMLILEDKYVNQSNQNAFNLVDMSEMTIKMRKMEPIVSNLSRQMKLHNSTINQLERQNSKLTSSVTAIEMNDMPRLRSLKWIAGYIVDGYGSTYILTETSSWFNFQSKWVFMQNRADEIFIFRGWKIEIAVGDYGSDGMFVKQNTYSKVLRFADFPQGKISSYRATWIGY